MKLPAKLKKMKIFQKSQNPLCRILHKVKIPKTSSLPPILKNPLTITLALYILAILLVSPWGNHAVNDDWDFYIHTRLFSQGIFAKNRLIDTAFVLQGLLGILWTKLFGFSFLSLRILTILFSFAFLFGAYKTLQKLQPKKTKKTLTALTLLTIIFNPLFFTSALSYMTEIYFLTFAIWSLYLFLHYLEKRNITHLLVASLLAGASLYIRQFGLVFLIAYFLVLAHDQFHTKKFKWKELVILVVPFISLLFLYTKWPQYVEASETRILGNPVDLENFYKQIKMYPYLIPYVAFFLSPLVYVAYKKIPVKVKWISLVAALLIFPLFYQKDIFAVGNVFYIEGFYTKSDFTHWISLFDNIPFKLGLSVYLSFTFLLGVYLFIDWLEGFIASCCRKDFDLQMLSLSLTVLGLFGVVFVGSLLTSDFYDRYFIAAFPFLTLLVGVYLSRSGLLVDLKGFYARSCGFIALSFLAIVTVFLTWDFYTEEELRWKLGYKFQEEHNLVTNVFVRGSFTRYMHVGRFDNPADVMEAIPGGLNYECFVQKDVIEPENPGILLSFLNRTENSRTFNYFYKNPEVFENKATAGVEPLEWHEEDFSYKNSYFSPIYSLLGKTPVIGGYCVTD
ncbi:hypothetical protein GF360_03440 [candidate division WWE3 bacterium]|nr:hypothetical protein [candidate division WWE3 bacterium]